MRVLGKGRIPASIEKLSRRVPKKGRIYVSTEKWWNPSEYREKVESLQVSKKFPANPGKGSNICEYRKKVESRRVPGKGRIRASIEKLSRPVPENDQMCEYRKMEDTGEYRE